MRRLFLILAALAACFSSPALAQLGPSSIQWIESTSNLTASSTFTGTPRSATPFYPYYAVCATVGSASGGTLYIYANTTLSNSGGYLLASTSVAAGSGQCLKVPFPGLVVYATYTNSSAGATNGLVITSQVTAN